MNNRKAKYKNLLTYKKVQVSYGCIPSQSGHFRGLFLQLCVICVFVYVIVCFLAIENFVIVVASRMLISFFVDIKI